jgi:Ca-activated chloride channel homolog
LLTARTSYHRSPFPKRSISLVLVLGLLLCFCTVASRSSPPLPVQSNEGLRFDLPANGNLRVENLRGGIIVQVGTQDYVTVLAIADGGKPGVSPAIVDRTEGLLSVRVSRGMAEAASQINLMLTVPERSHAAILTREGSVEVQGLPAALLVQTLSGNIRVEVPDKAGADVVAQSRTGIVTSSVQSTAVRSAARPQLRARIAEGGRSLRLYSQAGDIALAPQGAAASTRRTLEPVGANTPLRREASTPDRAPDTSTPTQRPQPAGTGWTIPPAGAGTLPPASSQPEEVSEGDIIRVDTELVSVNASVIDRGTNRGLNDLVRNDFRLFEDGIEQQIQHFESASAPFNLVLLIDLSGSTTRVVELIKLAALHFVEAARPFDLIAVITFAGAQVVVSPLTTDHQALRERIGAIQRPQGSTKLYDSVAFAMDEVFREAKDSRRNAVVVMSDGLDSVLPNVTGDGSKLSYEEVIRRAKEFDGVLYSIWVDTQSYEPLSTLDIQQETFDLAHNRLKELADVGGGLFYECEELKDLAGAYERVVADLGMVYTLSYRPTNKVRDGAWRSIRVNVNRPNAIARGKRGYYAK